MSDHPLQAVRQALSLVQSTMRKSKRFSETQRLAVKMFELAAGRAMSATEIRPDFALLDFHLRQDALFTAEQLEVIQRLRTAWHERLMTEALANDAIRTVA